MKPGTYEVQCLLDDGNQEVYYVRFGVPTTRRKIIKVADYKAWQLDGRRIKSVQHVYYCWS